MPPSKCITIKFARQIEARKYLLILLLNPDSGFSAIKTKITAPNFITRWILQSKPDAETCC